MNAIVKFGCAAAVAGACGLAQAADVSLNHGDYASDAEAGAALVAACKSTARQDNDTVTVGAGRWLVPEPIVLGRPMTLRAAERADRTKTVIDGGGVTNVLMTSSYSSAKDVVVDGFTFQNGSQMPFGKWQNSYMYGAVALHGGMMTNCIVRNMTSYRDVGGYTYGVGVTLKAAELADTIVADIHGEDHYKSWHPMYGGGVYAIGASKVHGCTITNCQIYGTYDHTTASDTAGGGVYLGEGSQAWNCEIAYNVSSNVVELTDNGVGGGAGVYVTDAGSAISNCYIHGNVAAMAAAGILVKPGACVYDCTVSNNLIRFGQLSGTKRCFAAGVLVDGGTGSRVERCRILDNKGPTVDVYDQVPGGLGLCSAVDVFVSDCVVRGNSGRGAAGVALMWTQGGAVFSNCVVQANVCGGRGGCGILAKPTVAGATMTITDTYIVSNEVTSANITASGVEFDARGNVNGDTVILRNCCLYGNKGGTGTINAFANNNYQHYFKVENCSVYDNSDTGINFYKDGTYYSAMSNVFVYGSVFINNGSKGNSNISGFNNVTNIWYTYEAAGQWATTQTQYDYHNIKDADLPEGAKIFVDAANHDYRMPKGGALCDKATKEDWMGTGRRRSRNDMGDGTWTEAKHADWGVRVVRNKSVPRLYGEASDMGCFEYYRAPGMVMILR